eukprot:109898_1
MNVNKITIQVTNGFPSFPKQWTDRFDIRIWNELQSKTNRARTVKNSKLNEPSCYHMKHLIHEKLLSNLIRKQNKLQTELDHGHLSRSSVAVHITKKLTMRG